MTLEMILGIIGLAVNAWQSKATGGAAETAEYTGLLVEIARKANQAHLAETGKPIDPSLLHPIQPV
jgi:hypothetical protein